MTHMTKTTGESERPFLERPFLERVGDLPVLGIGVSTEYGARTSGLDPFELARRYPRWARFLEVGVEVEKGLDSDALRWSGDGRATTYHFLDVNLDEPQDLESAWLSKVRGLAAKVAPAWMCGDLGLWHFGARDRAHMLLLPPILTAGSATAMAAGIVALRSAVGLEVLPENPPGEVFVGSMHILEYFARVAEEADTGLLVDLAHLAMFQRAKGLDVRAGLDCLPWERVVEIHIAGGTERDFQGYRWVEDSHGGAPLPEVWELFEEFVGRADNLKAVVFECERNTIEATVAGFERIEATCRQGLVGRGRWAGEVLA